MALPAAISRHMNDSIVYERCTSGDVRGARSFASPVTYTRCRVVKSQKPTKNRQGQAVVSTTQVTVNQVITTLSVNDRITLADGTQPPILNFFNRGRSPVASDLGHSIIEL